MATGEKLLATVRAGARVTINQYTGMGRGGPEYKPATGRAVMRGPAGWVLNMGGRYGTPAIADATNIIAVKLAPQREVPGLTEDVVVGGRGLADWG